jgi:hypothetical protein
MLGSSSIRGGRTGRWWIDVLLQGLQTIQQRRYNGVDQQAAAASSLLGRVMQFTVTRCTAREGMMNWHRSGRGCIDGVCVANEREWQTGCVRVPPQMSRGRDEAGRRLRTRAAMEYGASTASSYESNEDLE